MDSPTGADFHGNKHQASQLRTPMLVSQRQPHNALQSTLTGKIHRAFLSALSSSVEEEAQRYHWFTRHITGIMACISQQRWDPKRQQPPSAKSVKFVAIHSRCCLSADITWANI